MRPAKYADFDWRKDVMLAVGKDREGKMNAQPAESDGTSPSLKKTILMKKMNNVPFRCQFQRSLLML